MHGSASLSEFEVFGKLCGQSLGLELICSLNQGPRSRFSRGGGGTNARGSGGMFPQEKLKLKSAKS